MAETKKFLDSIGLQTLITKIKDALNTKQNKLTSTSPLGTGLGGTGRTTLTGANSLRSDLGLGAGSGALAVANGGTGATSFTANSVIVSGNTTTAALTTKAVTAANTANAIVTRDGSGNFVAGTITASLSGNATSATTATTATKLSNTTAVGSTTKPVYFTSGGLPAVCTSISLKADTAGTADTATKLGTANKGSTTKPIYLSGGTATECSTYAGGTLVTLNGGGKGGSTASFYAPTGVGTKGEYLRSNGSGEPSWRQSVYYGSGTPSGTDYYKGDIYIQY